MNDSTPPGRTAPIPLDLGAPEAGPAGLAPRWAVVGSFFILFVGALYFAKGFAVPVVLAFLFALVLSPVVRFFARRRVPQFVTATALVGAGVVAIAVAFYALSGPVTMWLDDLPRIGSEVERKLASFRQPVEQIEAASKQVDKLADGDAGKGDPDVQEVVVKEPGLASAAAESVPDFGAKFVFSVVLLLFLLASGDLFLIKLVRAMPSLTDKKRALRIAHDIERELSRYLFTIALINAGLGVAIGFSMWLAGMPNPVLWGILAALVNFVPYIGSMIGIILVTLVGLVEFPSLAQAFYPPALYLVCVTVEGQILTPMIVGRRLEMNNVAVFLAVAFWGWLWGIVGMLLAVPLMVGVKIFATHVEGLSALADFLSVEPAKPEPEEAVETEAAAAAAGGTAAPPPG